MVTMDTSEQFGGRGFDKEQVKGTIKVYAVYSILFEFFSLKSIFTYYLQT